MVWCAFPLPRCVDKLLSWQDLTNLSGNAQKVVQARTHRVDGLLHATRSQLSEQSNELASQKPDSYVTRSNSKTYSAKITSQIDVDIFTAIITLSTVLTHSRELSEEEDA